MRRVIKFRGQRQSDNEWIYGDLLQPTEFVNVYEISDCNTFDGSRYDVIEHTIGQFTGLHDKNGKEIYEGDIIQHWYDYSDITDRYLVKYDEDELSYVFQNLSNRNNFIALEDLYDEDYGDYSIEVIGNIYENSKFLKGADNIE